MEPPTCISASASERCRSNQLTTVVVTDRWPPKAAPAVSSRNTRVKVVRVSTRLSSISPRPKTTSPSRMMTRGPKRRSSHPCRGPSSPLSRRWSEKTVARAVLLQPNSSRHTGT